MNDQDHYLFTPDHQELRAAIRSWTAKRITPHVDEWERAGEFPRSVFEELGDLGYLGAQYPEEFGGQGETSPRTWCSARSYRAPGPNR